MIEILLKTLPFFGIIGAGYWAGRTGFFSAEATAYLTKFVFYFALSAMLFRFAATLSLSEVLDWSVIWAYLLGSFVVYALATLAGGVRKRGIAETAVEAQCAVIGNVGFIGIPMLVLLMGERAIGPVMMVLAVDLIVFGSLIVILITGAQDGRMQFAVLKTVGLGLMKNPMILSIVLGFGWAATGWLMPRPVDEFMSLLGGAATPGALFAIGASLAAKNAERIYVAGWLSFCKLFLHPLAVAGFALFVCEIDAYSAAVMIAAASLPVAGNIYMLAQHYGVAPARVSASILISTALSVFTVSTVIAWVSTFYT